jgi:hypothetical protein
MLMSPPASARLMAYLVTACACSTHAAGTHAVRMRYACGTLAVHMAVQGGRGAARAGREGAWGCRGRRAGCRGPACCCSGAVPAAYTPARWGPGGGHRAGAAVVGGRAGGVAGPWAGPGPVMRWRGGVGMPGAPPPPARACPLVAGSGNAATRSPTSFLALSFEAVKISSF